MQDNFDTSVLIVGGGPVGLGLALDLAWRGNGSILVEKDPRTAAVLLAKANGLNERTMETCRRWGLVGEVARVGFPSDHPGDSVYCTSMTGYYIGRSVLPSADKRPTPEETPEKRQRCPQYEFDPLLANEVKRLGLTDIRYGTEFVGFKQDADGVTVELKNLERGNVYTLRTRYLVGCDGAGSLVRRGLGVAFEGRNLDFSLSAMIRIPNLAAANPIKDGERYLVIDTTGTWGIMTSVDGRQIWRFTAVGSQEKLDPSVYDVSKDIRRALGSDKIEFEILRLIPWRRSQCVASNYRVGRVMLAGDSAHTTSPTGGHGMNTGLADAMDLSWMLDARLAGWGGDKLLDAYDRERRPVGVRNSAAAASNFMKWLDKAGYQDVMTEGPKGDECRAAVGRSLVEALNSEWNSIGVDLGFRYEDSPIIVRDGSAPTADDPATYIQTARPGHRAPHGWLREGFSTLDLFGRGFVLLRFGKPIPDTTPLEQAAASAGVPLKTVDIDNPKLAGLYERRLVLVRPDGMVAFRSDELPEDCTGLINTVRGAA
jgi:2-polyprenyl-6-methoxyphenol hydroxylase-like FAD-dependent oxidoreductase